MYLESNLEILKKSDPILFKLLSGAHTGNSEGFRVENSKSGVPTLLQESGGEKYFHSKYDPVAEAGKIASSLKGIGGKSPVVLIGQGLGQLTLSLLPRLGERQRLVVVEPSLEIFRLAIEHTDFSEPFKRDETYFLVGPQGGAELRKLVGEKDFKTSYYCHPTYLAAFPELKEVVGYLEGVTISQLKSELAYPKFQSSSAKVLLIEGDFFIEKEVVATLQGLGVACRTVETNIKGRGDAGFLSRLLTELAGFKPDFVLSINQIGFDVAGKLSGLLTHFEIPYACWFVDNPLPILQRGGGNVSDYAVYLLWDESYVEPMKSLGHKKVEYFPYGADSSIFHPPEGKYEKRYPVSFVGSSMQSVLSARLAEIQGNKELTDIYHAIAESDISLEGGINVEELVKKELSGMDVSERNLASLEVAVASRLSQRKRVEALLAVEDFKPHVFGDAAWEGLLPQSFNLHPPVDYRTELPDVYRFSEINLNISNVQLINSPNQRLFDVSACESFLLTDGMEAASRFLEPGKSVETFATFGELAEKVGYFLKNSDKRREVEERAFKEVTGRHTYRQRLTEMLGLLKAKFS